MKPKSPALDQIRVKLENERVRAIQAYEGAVQLVNHLDDALAALDFAPAKRRKAKKSPKMAPKQAKVARSRQSKPEVPAEPKKPRKRRSDAGQPRKGKGNGSGAADKTPGPAARAAAEQAGRNRADDGTQVGRDTSE